jgi:2-alkenal reductase
VVNRVVPALIKDGRTPNPGIGIVAAPEAATSRYGIDGVVIVRVQRGSPAASAGLAGLDPMTGTIGDIIVGANGEPVHRLADLTRVLEQAGIGGRVDLAILRDGNARTVRVGVADVAQAAQ